LNAEIQTAPVNVVPTEQRPPRERSKPGVASFLFALGGLSLLLALWATGALLEGRFDDAVRVEAIEGLSRMTRREEFDFLLAAFGGLGVMTLCLAGLALGVAGAFQRERKRLFAVLGIALNGLLLPLVAIPWVLFMLLWLLKPLAWH
jgi:hypothetical protein